MQMFKTESNWRRYKKHELYELHDSDDISFYYWRFSFSENICMHLYAMKLHKMKHEHATIKLNKRQLQLCQIKLNPRKRKVKQKVQ